jgi:hypothetical protein
MIRRHLNYANVVATFALVFAMSGGALAASHYLISSPKQIKPSVLKSLTGKAGPAGAAGANGATGPAGPTGPGGPQGAAGTNGTGTNGTDGTNGKEGKEGKEGPPGPTEFKVLPSGQSEHGVLGFTGEEGEVEGYKTLPLSFSIPLPAAIEEAQEATNVHVVEYGETAPEECEEGTLAEPKAAPGNLCIYIHSLSGAVIGNHNNPGKEITYNPESESGLGVGVGRSGALLSIYRNTTEQTVVRGVWVVTAPK